MNARPPFEPAEPLDVEEAAMARAYRRLPGAEPSPELDARILAQARAAVVHSKRRPRPWFLGAGFGAAAAAVMAAGVAWQLGWLGGIPGTAVAPGSSQRSDTAAPRRVESAPAATEETIDIDYVKEERKAKTDDDAPAPAAAAPADMRRQNTVKPPAPAAAPPPPQEKSRDESASVLEQPVLSAPEPQPFPAESSAAPASLGVTGARAASEREGMAEQDAAAGPERFGLSKQIAALPPWTDDERLEPDAWLERIRERVNRNERQSAIYSLRRFVQVHPQRDVPRELQRLLVE